MAARARDQAPDATRVRLGPAADPRLGRTGLADQLGFSLRVAQLAVWADLVETLAPFSLRPQQFAALLVVRANPGCKQQDVAAALGIKGPNAVKLVDELARNGWLAREVNPADRRSYAFRLTGSGEDLVAAADRAHAGHLARIGDCLAPEEAPRLLSALGRLARIGDPR